MSAPAPPTEGERLARGAFVEARNDVALLIETLNRGLAPDAEGYAEVVLDLREASTKLSLAADRLWHNLPQRADAELRGPKDVAATYFLVWPDGERFMRRTVTGFALLVNAEAGLLAARHDYPELRLYNANDQRVEEVSP